MRAARLIILSAIAGLLAQLTTSPVDELYTNQFIK
jgi:hypothetical protein